MKSIVSRTNKFLNLVDKCENISPSGYVDKRFKELVNDNVDIVRVIFLTKEGKDAFHRATVSVRLTYDRFKDMLAVYAECGGQRFDYYSTNLFRTLKVINRNELNGQLNTMDENLRDCNILLCVPDAMESVNRYSPRTIIFNTLSGKVEGCRDFGCSAYVNTQYYHNIANILSLDSDDFYKEENISLLLDYEEQLLNLVNESMTDKKYSSLREFIIEKSPELNAKLTERNNGAFDIDVYTKQNDVYRLRELYGVVDSDWVTKFLKSKSYGVRIYG